MDEKRKRKTSTEFASKPAMLHFVASPLYYYTANIPIDWNKCLGVWVASFLPRLRCASKVSGGMHAEFHGSRRRCRGATTRGEASPFCVLLHADWGMLAHEYYASAAEIQQNRIFSYFNRFDALHRHDAHEIFMSGVDKC